MGSRRPDAGSSLLLMPAALLVMIVLGALAIDVSAVHQAQRELITAAQAGADDAAVAAWDPAAYYGQGTIRLRPAAARREAIRSVRVSDPDLRVVRVQVVGDEVWVEVRGRVRPIFGAALTGASGVEIHGRARAELAR